MKIAVFDAETWERDVLRCLETEHAIVATDAPLSAANADRFTDAEILSTFIHSDLGRGVLMRFPDLKLIATRSTGYNHIAVDFCRERGIAVANVPTYGTNTVAEHSFALMLAIAHRLIDAADRTRRGDFSNVGLRGFDLFGKTLGVIGTGEIGRCVIRMAKGFDMKVLAFDTRPTPHLAHALGFDYVPLVELLAASDIITLHVPATPQTEAMIGDAEFARMKDGAVLINTARGSVVDTEALLRALSTGKLAAAGLDVLPEEPVMREEAELLRAYFRRAHNLDTLLADHILLRMRNVVITPHNAFNTTEAVRRILDTTCDNIRAFASGRPINLITG